jgi:hypothetical protein
LSWVFLELNIKSELSGKIFEMKQLHPVNGKMAEQLSFLRSKLPARQEKETLGPVRLNLMIRNLALLDLW